MSIFFRTLEAGSMKSKTIIKFYELIKLLLIIIAIWSDIRDNILIFLEENMDKLDSNFLDTLAFFGEVLDHVSNELRSHAMSKFSS